MSKAAKVLIASDHAGVDLKQAVQERVKVPNLALTWEDLGPKNADRCDYPDFASALARRVASGDADYGVLICGTGIGMSITANKVKGIRAALIENEDSAKLTREHNDTNIICLGARVTPVESAIQFVEVFLGTPFSGEERHIARLEKIQKLENEG